MVQKRGRFERLDAAIPIEIQFLTPTPEAHVVLCDNIGGKGFRFSLGKKLEADTPLELTLYLPDDKPPLKAKGKVSWVREASQMPGGPTTLFDIGVAFVGLTFQGKDRIHHYIYRRVKGPEPPQKIK